MSVAVALGPCGVKLMLLLGGRLGSHALGFGKSACQHLGLPARGGKLALGMLQGGARSIDEIAGKAGGEVGRGQTHRPGPAGRVGAHQAGNDSLFGHASRGLAVRSAAGHQPALSAISSMVAK